MRFGKFWLVPAVLLSALTGCEYSGPPEGAATPQMEGSRAPVPLTGRTEAPAPDPRASELEEMRNWSSQQLQPAVPGQFAGSTSSNTTVSFGFAAAKPGNYDVQFICDGPAETQLSLASDAGAEVLAPVQVPCDGNVFTTQVAVATQGVEFIMTPGGASPGGGTDGRYAFRLIPAQQELPTTLLQSGGGQKTVVHAGQWSAPRVPAQLSGTLANDGAGCVVLQADGGDGYTMIFPKGTEFDGETLVMPAGPPLSPGSRVSVGGARVAANESLSMCLNYGRLLSVETAAVIP